MRRKLRSEIVEALGDRLVLIESVEVQGDAVLTRWRVSGRNDRGIRSLGIGPNGRRLDVEIVTVDRPVDGVLRRATYLNLQEVYDQLRDDTGGRAAGAAG